MLTNFFESGGGGARFATDSLSSSTKRSSPTARRSEGENEGNCFRTTYRPGSRNSFGKSLAQEQTERAWSTDNVVCPEHVAPSGILIERSGTLIGNKQRQNYATYSSSLPSRPGSPSKRQRGVAANNVHTGTESGDGISQDFAQESSIAGSSSCVAHQRNPAFPERKSHTA